MMVVATRFVGWIALPLAAVAAFAMSDVATPASQPDAAAPGALACYQAATERTFLTEYQGRELCRGSDSDGPVLCYLAAEDRLDLAEPQGVSLCQCALDEEPVTCFETAVAETDLSDAAILNMCNARSLRNVVLPNCTPLAMS